MSTFSSVVVFVIGLLGNTQPLPKQQPQIDEEPTLGPTIFDTSPCAPPCWFGLEAGVSTVEDVRTMFSSHEGVFWNEFVEVQETDLKYFVLVMNLSRLENSDSRKFIDFFWRDTTFAGSFTVDNGMAFEGNIVEWMSIKPNRPVLAHEVITYLGSPTTIRTRDIFYHSYIIFLYRDLNMILHLTLPDSEDCQIANVMQEFPVEYVRYYTVEGYREEASELSRDSSYVSSRQWLNWISGESDTSCREAIGEL